MKNKLCITNIDITHLIWLIALKWTIRQYMPRFACNQIDFINLHCWWCLKCHQEKCSCIHTTLHLDLFQGGAPVWNR